MKVYGIKNCDTVKKALKWLDANSMEFEFHDFKKQAPSESLIKQWFTQVPMDKLINKRGTTWRQLDDDDKNLDDKNRMKQLIKLQPTLLKRPLVEFKGQWHVGFNAEDWQQRY